MAVKLSVHPRDITGKKVKQLRREGMIPAILFGHGIESREVSVPMIEFARVQHRISSSTLIDLVPDGGASTKALLHHVQQDPRTNKPIHLELLEVRMDEKIKVEVSIHVDGTSPAVSQLGGTLVVAHSTVEIRTSPDHLMSSLHVDVSRIETFDDHVTAGDLDIPEGVELLTSPDIILISVTPPRLAEPEPEVAAAEPEAAPAAAAAAAPEGSDKG